MTLDTQTIIAVAVVLGCAGYLVVKMLRKRPPGGGTCGGCHKG
ncbi:MAG: FeoB-associated Cys-rich membrane protein [Planctomycetes bacterium]|nr:FeoB-associated Cys-rich membrane protein [Planctomycetota bacterium]